MDFVLGVLIGFFSNVFAGLTLQTLKQKDISELDLEETKKLRKLETQHKLNQKNIENEAKLQQLKMKFEQQTRDYEVFLNELDKMKAEIINTFQYANTAFQHANTANAILIHHYASELLEQMWNENDIDRKTTLNGRFFILLDAITDDIKTLKTTQDGTYYRPEKTINLIMSQKN